MIDMTTYARAVDRSCANAFQVGALRGGMKVAVQALELGKPEFALEYLRKTLAQHEAESEV